MLLLADRNFAATALVEQIAAARGTRVGRYRLATTMTDEKRYPADELVDLYHRRWEIETGYLEL
jgi:hypothetical protein